MLEVAARGGRLILVTDAEGAEGAAGQRLMTFIPPTVPATVAPLVYALPVQFIALPGNSSPITPRSSWAHRDVDQPRNLAKSVTVEVLDGRSMRLAYRVQQVGKRTDCYTAVTAWKGEPC